MWDGATVTAGEATEHLAAAADRLRAVRVAHGRFLMLWAADHILADMLNDVAGQLADADGGPTSGNRGTPVGLNRPVYGGRLLDD